MTTPPGSTQEAMEEASFRVNASLLFLNKLVFFSCILVTLCAYLTHTGLASSTDNIYTQTDVKSVYIYENQRWNPVTGYTNRLI